MSDQVNSPLHYKQGRIEAIEIIEDVVAGTVVLYTRIPSMTKLYISELKLELTELVLNAMPKQIEEAMPELPTKTGLPIKFP